MAEGDGRSRTGRYWPKVKDWSLMLLYDDVQVSMLKLKLQYLGHLMHRADSLVKILILEKMEGRRRRGRQRIRWWDGITDSKHMSLSKGQGGLVCCSSWGHKELNTT